MNRKLWLYSLLLMIPVVALYIAHFSMGYYDGNHLPTGFIHYDMPYYLSNAREYSEADSISLFFKQPFSPNYDNQAIYFYPHLFVLGLLMKFTSIPPAVLFLGFGFLFGLLAIRICLKILTSFINPENRLFTIVSILLVYGGGLLILGGMLINLLKGLDLASSWEKALYLDPGDGLWFLNIGRNFTAPMEAYYHFLFFSSVYLIQKNKILPAVLTSTLLSLSHPFTGVLVLSVMGAWLVSERFLAKNKEVKWLVLVILFASSIWFLVYNFILLPKDADHQALMNEWTLNFHAKPISFMLGYLLVLVPAVIRLSSRTKFRSFLALPFNRFLGIWLLLNLFWENHHYFIKATQPLHFTRGYVWFCLFLIGAPVIIDFLKKIYQSTNGLTKTISIGIVFVIGLSDNLGWFIQQSIKQYKGKGEAIYLLPDQQSVIYFLRNNYSEKELLVSSDTRIGYLSTVYSSYRPAYSHKFNTPYPTDAKKNVDKFIASAGENNPYGNSRIIAVTSNKVDRSSWNKHFNLVFENNSYLVWRKK